MEQIVFVDVSKLSERLLSRERGNEIVNKLVADYRENEVIGINLDNVAVISLSFLDGMILAFDQKKLLKQVAFRTRKPDTLDKLACISGLRNIAVYDDSLRQITPKVPKDNATVRVSDKGSLINV